MANKDGYSSDKTSQFNAMMAKMERISYSWSNLNEFKREGRINAYKNELDIVADEIIPDAMVLLSPKDYKKFIVVKLNGINTKIIENLKIKNNKKIWYWLRAKERVLRYVDNLTGRGLKINQKRNIKRAIELG